MPPMPRNDQTLKIPCSPSLGSQKFRAISHGLRGRAQRVSLAALEQTDPDPGLGEALRHDRAAEPEPTTTTAKWPSGAELRSGVTAAVPQPPILRILLTAFKAGRTGAAAGQLGRCKSSLATRRRCRRSSVVGVRTNDRQLAAPGQRQWASIHSAERSATAAIVSDGFGPTGPGSTDPSATESPG